MKTSHIILLASELLAVSAVALPNIAVVGNAVAAQGAGAAAGGAAEGGAAEGGAAEGGAAEGGAAEGGAAEGGAAEGGAAEGGAAEGGAAEGDAAAGEGDAAAGEEGAAEGEEGGENEIEQDGQFDTAIELGGGDIKTDTLFPPGDNGSLEVEFQNADARTLTVTENATPGTAPAGFDFLEPVSYVIDLAEGTEGLTLQKVDYVLTAGNTLDISQGQVGKLCTETNTFVVGAGVGELEFEAEENELSLTVDDMNGEWGIFVPSAAGAAAGGAAGNESEAAAGGAAEGGAAGGTAGTGAACTTQLCAVLQLLGVQ